MMNILDCDNMIYDNAIEMYFYEYFEMRNIDISGDHFKTVPTNVYQAAFRYVYKKLFKPDETTARRYHKTSKIDYQDAYTLEQIIDIYGDIVMSFNIKATQNMFCDLTGIHRDTLHSWESGDTRAYIYLDCNNNIISDISGKVLIEDNTDIVFNNINSNSSNNINNNMSNSINDKGYSKGYRKVLSAKHSDLVKKIKSFSHITAYNGLNDTPVGQITHANNSVEAGMEYNNKRQMESAKALILTAAELPKLGQIEQQLLPSRAEYNELSQ